MPGKSRKENLKGATNQLFEHSFVAQRQAFLAHGRRFARPRSHFPSSLGGMKAPVQPGFETERNFKGCGSVFGHRANLVSLTPRFNEGLQMPVPSATVFNGFPGDGREQQLTQAVHTAS